jgi:hypothetical protein
MSSLHKDIKHFLSFYCLPGTDLDIAEQEVLGVFEKHNYIHLVNLGEYEAAKMGAQTVTPTTASSDIAETYAKPVEDEELCYKRYYHFLEVMPDGLACLGSNLPDHPPGSCVNPKWALASKIQKEAKE